MNNILMEVSRCLNCNNKPCLNKCPLNNDIPRIMALVKDNEFKEAYKVLCETTVLQSVCGRICPHEKQCQSSCTRKYKETAISIGEVEKTIGDLALEEDFEIPMISEELKNKKVAVVGSGPAGLTLVAFLARRMASVTIYEKREKLGGLLRYGIPDFRLDKNVLDKVLEKILNIGLKQNNGSRLINIEAGKELGKDVSLADLQEKYDAVFLSFGANVPRKMNIPGEELPNVFMGNTLLEYNKHPNYDGKEVIVSGGGNVAIDVARTVKRLGASKVVVVYRRSEEEMPAERKEVLEAKSEGVEFIFNTNILEVINEDNATKAECIKTCYAGSEEARKLVNVENSNFELKTDFVIMAIGGMLNSEAIENTGIKLTNKGLIDVNENYQTSCEKVFAGGDLIEGKNTVAWAARYGRNAAESITKFLTK